MSKVLLSWRKGTNEEVPETNHTGNLLVSGSRWSDDQECGSYYAQLKERKSEEESEKKENETDEDGKASAGG